MSSIASDTSPPLSATALSRLKWRCRRGLLENDLFIARFFERHGSRLTERQGQAMQQLMDLSDNDLLDLLLRRTQATPDWAGPDVTALLQTMHTDGAHRSANGGSLLATDSQTS